MARLTVMATTGRRDVKARRLVDCVDLLVG
jgi:hypothetical protein